MCRCKAVGSCESVNMSDFILGSEWMRALEQMFDVLVGRVAVLWLPSGRALCLL